MKKIKMRSIMFCVLAVALSVMLVLSSVPVVIGDKPHHYKNDIKRARQYYQQAMQKIKHDLKLLKEGVEENDIEKKEAAKKSLQEAIALLDKALAEYGKAKANASRDLQNKPKTLQKVLSKINSEIVKTTAVKNRCLAFISLIDYLIQLERLKPTVPDDKKVLIEKLEEMIIRLIEKIYKGKNANDLILAIMNLADEIMYPPEPGPLGDLLKELIEMLKKWLI